MYHFEEVLAGYEEKTSYPRPLSDESTLTDSYKSQISTISSVSDEQFDSKGLHQINQTVRAKRCVGRPKKANTITLFALKNKRGNPVKEEYIRCSQIRIEKKFARQISEKRLTPKSMRMFNIKSSEDRFYWERLKAVYSSNPSVFNALSPTTTGPATDGRGRRVEAAAFNSHNKKCCAKHYASKEVREFHFYCILLTYGKQVTDLDALCKKYKYHCCKSGLHTKTCAIVWEQVREYLLYTMIEDLGLQPFIEFDEVPDLGIDADGLDSFMITCT